MSDNFFEAMFRDIEDEEVLREKHKVALESCKTIEDHKSCMVAYLRALIPLKSISVEAPVEESASPMFTELELHPLTKRQRQRIRQRENRKKGKAGLLEKTKQ